MKYHIIDNSLKNLGKTVLWQYDKAVRLLSVLKHMQVLYHCAVEQFWNYWNKKILSIDTCDALGCSIWGIFLGVPRPQIKDLITGEERLIETTVYRKLLKGAFYLMKASSSFEDILGYLEIVFGVGGEENLSPWKAYVSEEGWYTNIEELNNQELNQVAKYYPRLAYAKGVVFLDETSGGKWLCLDTITAQENASLESLQQIGKIESTTRPATIEREESTLLFKLYDPQGICRKISGAPIDALTIRVEYEIGETKVVAEATRRRKCGIMITDNGDMSMTYSKSEYYDEMHRDQKALFEQKLEEFCPYPLGVKTNEPIGNWVFGLPNADEIPPGVEYYQVGKAYSKTEGSLTKDNSCLVRLKDESEKLARVGAVVLVEFTTNVSKAGYDLEREPYSHSRVLAHYFTVAEAKVANPNVLEHNPANEYPQGAKVIMDFSPLISQTDDHLRVVTFPVCSITGEENAFFYKLFQITESNKLYDGQSNVLYENGIAYHKGDIFGYIESDGNGCNWKVQEDITAAENVAFDSIKSKLQKTSEGGPFIDGLGEEKSSYPFLYYKNISLPIWIETADLSQVCTIVPAGRLVVGLENGIDKIFHNNTGGSLMICHTTLDKTAYRLMLGFTDWIGTEEPTEDNIRSAIAELCRKHNCPVVDFGVAINYMPGILYLVGDLVIVDGKERIVKEAGVWNTKAEFISASFPQSKACLHKYYGFHSLSYKS